MYPDIFLVHDTSSTTSDCPSNPTFIYDPTHVSIKPPLGSSSQVFKVDPKALLSAIILISLNANFHHKNRTFPRKTSSCSSLIVYVGGFLVAMATISKTSCVNCRL